MSHRTRVLGLALVLALLPWFAAGCGSASGIKPGVPASPPDPVNSTPDMGPAATPKNGKAA